MNRSEKKYQPIDCNYYDRLEAWAVLREMCRIVYTADSGQQQEVSGRIADLNTAEGVEYLKLDTEQVIRLDRLLSVNGFPLPGHCSPK